MAARGGLTPAFSCGEAGVTGSKSRSGIYLMPSKKPNAFNYRPRLLQRVVRWGRTANAHC